MWKCYEKKSIRLLEFLGSLSCSSTSWSRGACCFDDLLTKYRALDTDRDASVCLLQTSVADVCIFFRDIWIHTGGQDVPCYSTQKNKLSTSSL